MGKKANNKQSKRSRMLLLVMLFPIIIIILIAVYITSYQIQQSKKPIVPEEFIPIYKAAEAEYGVPWYLLAAHHRIETIFSTMETMVSPVGAEGHMQFMPCSFVGWSHPTCGGLGKGEIPEEEKTDPEVIKKYNGYGVDANGDGKADPWDIEDAIFSAANYLADHGAANGELQKAIYAYNHSDKYVEDVLYYFELYKEEFSNEKNENGS
ncbi:lytic transglycosylase domain-containing protein [Lederbergia graminis]|uniref:Lytic transglycosylase domain-containing protein n=1 Tax=Lederbergia graminis TaxID=735518 RepID=A0ABW0LGN9_9BACI